MGSGGKMVCPHCDYEFQRSEGVGFLFPMQYKETVEKAKSGKLGKEMKQFFSEHTDGAINAYYVTLCCDDCGELSSGMDLTMYIPKPEKPSVTKRGKWSDLCSGDGINYVMEYELEEDYVEYMKYPHKCKKCKGKMHVVQEDEDLKCPHCKTELEWGECEMWD